jgi:hypothetical protein
MPSISERLEILEARLKRTEPESFTFHHGHGKFDEDTIEDPESEIKRLQDLRQKHLKRGERKMSERSKVSGTRTFVSRHQPEVTASDQDEIQRYLKLTA